MMKVNNQNEAEGDLMQKLGKLNEWQEEQKRVLLDRQNQQRKNLGLQQQNMFQMLGLSRLAHDDDSEHGQSDQDHEDAELGNSAGPIIPKNYNDVIANAEQATRRNAALLNETASKPKKRFLKRGEGLKRRFNIDPEELRLNNLPRYKYSKAHRKNIRQMRSKSEGGSSSVSVQLSKKQPCDASSNTDLDAQEKRFQQLLISSKHVCNSTPDEKSSSTSFATAPCRSSKVRFEDQVESSDRIVQNDSNNGCNLDLVPTVSWSKVLNPQQIQPISVRRARSKSVNDLDTSKNEESLNIFQLLEQRAANGSIDMNSSSIQEFIDNVRGYDADDIPIETHMKLARLEPLLQNIFNLESSSAESEEIESEPCSESDAKDTSSKETSYISECGEDTTLEAEKTDAAVLNSIFEDSTKSVELFERFKNALFSVLQKQIGKGPEGDATDSKISETALPSNDSATDNPVYPGNLQEKTDLIKTRLKQLEDEIVTFKTNNLRLLKSMQEHEMEKAQFAKERQEHEDQLKDEKIQIEIYLHDERMKIEQERRDAEVKLRKSAAKSKERMEIAKLKQDLDEAQLLLKQKEQTHASAQARLRSQIRNLEKEQKHLYDEIEQLTKENKKLQNENFRIGRENNQKMLHEINRNIAKLAPQLNKDEDTVRSKKVFTVNKVDAVKPKKAPSKNLESLGKAPSTHSNANTNAKKTRNSFSFNEKDLSILVEEHKRAKSKEVCASSKANKTTDDSESEDEINTTTEDQADIQNGTKQENENTVNNTDNTAEFKREITNSDGSKDIWYPNGNIKKISADGMIIRMLYFNKDIKETNINEGTVKYYYAETNTWHTTYLDGLEILEFPNGQTERRYKDGKIEVHYPNHSVKVINPSDDTKLEEWTLADGTILTHLRNGDKIIMLPNGQKEIHTKAFKRREYPDGTVKLVYPDGSHETRYSNGRVRLRDASGVLVMDTENDKS